MKNLTFPRTYTTAGAVYRAKKNYTERFPDKTFVVVKQDGVFVLDSVEGTTTQQVERVETQEEAQEETEPPKRRGRKKKQVVENEFDEDPTYIDLDETKMVTDDDLFDDEDDYYVEPFGWEN